MIARTAVPIPVTSVASRVRRACDVVRRVIGVPDYSAYVAHMAAAHPSEPVLSREAFVAERMAARYQQAGNRCC